MPENPENNGIKLMKLQVGDSFELLTSTTAINHGRLNEQKKLIWTNNPTTVSPGMPLEILDKFGNSIITVDGYQNIYELNRRIEVNKV